MSQKNAREKIEQMKALRLSGKTYDEIGKEVGLSKQRVYQLIGGNVRHRSCIVSEESCVYCELRNWLNERELGLFGLVRLIYGKFIPNRYQMIQRTLKGANCTKDTIDKILNATGLPYEVAFRKG